MSNPNIKVSISGDYAVLEVGALYFYYGYEYVWCIDHAKFTPRCGDECETEWAFTVKREGKYIDKHRCSSEFGEFEVEQQLLYGIGKYIAAKQQANSLVTS